MADRTCSIDGCEKPVKARGWCSMHCERWRRFGDVNPGPRPRRPRRVGSAFERFIRKIAVDPTTGCWLWTAGRDASGYAQFGLAGTNVTGHVVAYRLLVGEIPDGLHLDHLCRVRRCVNPRHLEPVTPAENNRRTPWWEHYATRTHCERGHAFDEANTRIGRWGRICRECEREGRRRRTEERALGLRP